MKTLHVRSPIRPILAIALVLFSWVDPANATGYQGFDVYAQPAAVDPNVRTADPEFHLVAKGQSIYSDPVGGQYHALVNNLPSGAATDLNPPVGYSSSLVFGTDGVHQVGVAASNAGDAVAALWSGTSGSFVSLANATYVGARAFAVGGNEQVGVAGAPGTVQNTLNRAVLWHGSGASMVDLTPYPLSSSYDAYALGTDGTHQVGWTQVPAGLGAQRHASLWSGTAASWVDLNPATGYISSKAIAVAGNQEVGWGEQTSTNFNRALLWSGSAASVVDLTPDQFNISIAEALGTNGANQVGFGDVVDPIFSIFREHALLWNGTAASAVDLHDLLPSGFSGSRAYSIDDTGAIWGLATSSSDGLTHVVKWTAVPEPSALLTTAALCCLAVGRHRGTGWIRL